MSDDAWLSLLGADPRPWLLEAGEPAARWVTLTALCDRPEDDPEVAEARAASVGGPAVRDIVERLYPWAEPTRASGHNSPAYTPNLLELLADHGLGRGDEPRVDALLEAMLEHQDPGGGFLALSRPGHGSKGRPADPVWSSLACDRYIIAEILIRFGYGGDPRVKAALGAMGAEMAETAQGPSWLCRPDLATGFRGPGRKADLCPQAALEALRAFARVPTEDRPARLLEAARVSLGAWSHRREQKPYMFGHGRRFLTAKWPSFWYDGLWFLDTLGRYPELWAPATAETGARETLAEVVAGVLERNVGPGGRVTPRSCYQGFGGHSFGQKKLPSPFATARLAAVLRRFADLEREVRERVSPGSCE